MRQYIQRKVRAYLLRYFREDLRLAYDRGYITGLEDAGGPAFEDGFVEGFVEGMSFATTESPCAAAPS
jgi:hypothetical protein